MQRKRRCCVRDGADDGLIGLAMKKIVTDNQRGMVSRLFMTSLRIEVRLDDVPLFHHISLPTGSPQSISTGSYSPVKPSNRS